MTPTPEQIAAMEARGWRWDPEWRDFSIVSSDDTYRIALRVRPWHDGWAADYGWTGVSFAPLNEHPDPLTAADEAEAWLRSILAPLASRLPWLHIDP